MKIKGCKGSEAYRTLEVEGSTPFGSTYSSGMWRTASRRSLSPHEISLDEIE